MLELGGVEETRRRLPLWMQDKASKPDGEDKSNEVGHGVDSGNSKPIKQRKKAALQPEKGESKIRKRKISQQDAACDAETVSSKKMVVDVPKNQVRDSSLRKIKETTVSLSNKDTKFPSPVDDDVELTPDDLLSIAKEYVKADKDISVRELSIKECEPERQLSATASFSTKSENSLVDDNKRLPSHSTQSLADENHFNNTRRTGDPAQDMLDLLLGPLLKKPVEEKRTKFISKDLTFPTEFGNQGQNDLKEETAPLSKKKSTLRDKVAMLMD